MTTLAAIVHALSEAGQLVRAPDRSVDSLTQVTTDSRTAREGSLFCAIDGVTEDGHEYLADAARRGASAALVSRRLELPIPQVEVRDSRIAAAIAAAVWCGRPAESLTMVGVTGTNGKTTTVALIRHLLNAGKDVASIGTLGTFNGAGDLIPETVSLTTPGPVELHAALAALRRRGVSVVVLEASSHSLHQRRAAGIPLRVGVFTNLSHEHLDYHGSLDSYRTSKLLLAEQVTAGGAVVVNVDVAAWEALETPVEVRRIHFGTASRADVRAGAVERISWGSRFTLQFADHRVQTELPLIGDFNVSNSIAAAATAWFLGMAPEEIAQRLRDSPQVPGRMERLVSDRFVVLRDYAHTADAMDRVIKTLKPITPGRLVILFGCGGDRDRKKRSVMGQIAARGADRVVLTSDNPRTEDPERIISDIEEGIEGAAYLKILDREEAIHRAMTSLEPGDCLLLAGKGHETYQIVGTVKHPFDERAIVLEARAARIAS